MWSRRIIPTRAFSVARMALNTTRTPSSCAPGTVLNLKMKKSGNEPVALEDEEYPEWLWDCLNKDKQEQLLKETDFMKWRRKQLKKSNTAKIKDNNFLSKM